MTTNAIRIVFMMLALGASVAQETEVSHFKVTLEVGGLVANTGKVHVSLFGAKKDYMRKPLQTRELAVGTEELVTLTFSDLAPGKYAITLFYDENSNGELDTRIFGIPKEKVGFSNNAWRKFGPAKWKDASFKIDDSDLNLKIRARRIGDKEDQE